MALTETASLLGLATELRCAMYEHIIMTDMRCDGFVAWRDPPRFRMGANGQPRKGRDKLLVPWVNMKRTCRTTYSELKDFMRTGSIVNNIENRTWQLNLPLYPTPTLLPRHTDYRFGNLTWQRLPCAPHKLRALHLKIRIPKVHRTKCSTSWFEENNSPYDHCKLYRIIDYMLCCGPLMDVRSQLDNLLHVEKVILELEFEADYNPSKIGEIDYWTERDREDYVNELYGEVRKWCNRDIAYGTTDNFEIVSQFGTSTLQV
ncbi:hypothetical protein CERZMDRAFT_95526 [Cercospora zeae-maydis SCOH1-5]|uniref:Uncharacterized protein n=1 Tax=Cercospora zeae-maydis SCOH1-5 TaxID=717836 RepID=A0A6A6FLA8_9PEZI|nr:hypothetical protein CERZMDRAFT_95526 [Cercospora zeae-maydis SCOH1-5]